MRLLILMACLTQGPTFEGDPALAEMLRDAQVSNREAFRSGRMTGRIHNAFHDPDKIKHMRIDFEVWWDGDKTFWKLMIRDERRTYTVRAVDHDYTQEPESEYLLHADGKYYIYDSIPKLLILHSDDKFDVRYLEVNPWDSWFCCEPPHGKAGPLWLSQIGTAKDPIRGSTSHFAIERQGDDLIRQVRKDLDGGVKEILFSMKACGNVVETKYTPTDPRQSAAMGTYTWRTLPDGLCVLDGWNFSMTKSPQGNVDANFELKVDSIDVKTPVDSARFTLDFLLRQLPPNIILQDNITRTRKRVNVTNPPADITKSLEALASPLRGRGFLKADR
jgi:hypothetical protein